LRNIARKIGLGRVLALGLLVLLLAVRVWDPAPLETLRLKTFDLYQIAEPRAPSNQPIVIVDIDEESLAALGQWPWPRTLIAELVRQITAYNAVAIAFDFVFPEPDRLSPPMLAEQMANLPEAVRAELRGLPSSDAVFAQAIRESRVVLGQSGLPRKLDSDRPIKTVPIATIGGDPRRHLFHFDGMVRNRPEHEDAAAGLGVFTLVPERDGIVRRVPAMINVGGTILPTLALEMLRVATGQTTYAVKVDEAGVKSVVIAGSEVPTDRNARLWVHFSRFDNSRYVSAKDVIAGTARPERLSGNLVFIGTSATGLLDIKTTPVDKLVPGVEVHAQLLESILTGSYLDRPYYALGAEVSMAVLVSLLLIVFVPIIGAVWTLLLGSTVALSLAAGSWYLYVEQKILLDVAFPLVASFAIYGFLVYENYFREESQKRQVRGAFGQYLSPALVEQLADHPDRLVLGGESKVMTFLFSDVRGFTTISEQYRNDPQSLTRLINRLLTPLSDAILETNGTIDKYMGDCVMAFWNAPLDDPDHAVHACEAALDMVARLDRLNEERRREAEAAGKEVLELHVGVGINTGPCTVGNMGSEQRFDYSVLGDAVNLASRLEGQSRNYGVTIVVGESTAVAADGFALLELDLIAVKGKTEPERVFALLGGRELADQPGFQALAAANGELLARYRGRDWAGALQSVADCQAKDPGLGLEPLFTLHEMRIQALQASPPGPDWNGVTIAETK